MDVFAFFQYLFAHEPTSNLASSLVEVFTDGAQVVPATVRAGSRR